MSSPSSTPVPLLRPPLPGTRSTGGARTPRLGLAIPLSPSQRPVNTPSTLPDLPALQPPRSSTSRSAAPQLRLATPLGSNSTPSEVTSNPRPPFGAAGDDHAPYEPGRISGPSSASSASHSAISIGTGLRLGINTPDPASAVTSYSQEGHEKDGTTQTLPDLSKLSLEKGRDLDVDDLDDEGWMAASAQGKIEELGTLGEGAGGAVTKCRLRGGKVIFALKVITTDPDPDVQKQIKRELEFNRKIAAEHICKYYGAFGDPQSGIISIIMECCEGGSLDAIYKKVKNLGGRIGEKVLGKIAEGVLEGLTYLYKCKIIHRDIKPSNILLSRDGIVKLCDFGVSGEFGTREDADTFIGTSYYMAPERITGQSYTINSDVWSLGVTLLEVAQHRFPFPADGTEDTPQPGLIEIIQFIVAQPLPKLKDEPANGNEPAIIWSQDMKYFIECCLEKDPSRRATPWRLLDHPWIAEMKGKRVNMSKFLKQVWGWNDD